MTSANATAPALQSDASANSVGECDTPVGLRTNSIAVGTTGDRMPASWPAWVGSTGMSPRWASARCSRARGPAGNSTIGVTDSAVTPIVEFPEGPRARLQRALAHLGDIPVLPTQAGHDAGILSPVVPTAMLFVRNPTGVSHSPTEFADAADCNAGAVALADVMADWVTA
jgi:hypothetical protein